MTLKWIGVGCLIAMVGGCSGDRAPAHWTVAASAGALDVLAIDLLDGRIGLAAGDIDPRGLGGRLYETRDGGHTWRASAASTEIVTGLHFVDATTGWLAGYAGRIARTDDAGRTWRLQRSEQASEVLNAICPVDKNHVWAVGARGLMLRTDDGGGDWRVVDSGRHQDLWAVRFVSPSRGWIAGDGGLVLETTDAGDHWTPVESHTTRRLYGIAALAPATVVAVGEAGTIVRSEDGRRWETSAAGTTTLNAIAGAGTGSFWAVGDRGAVAGSSDRGKTWTVIQPPTTARLSAIALADDRHGIAAGKHGVTLVLE